MLTCSDGHSYPIHKNVPCLLLENHSHVISDSFSHQWAQFNYDNDLTWGKSADERIEEFLRQLEVHAVDVKGKMVLDAGCGNGILSEAIKRLGARVIATDVSESVFAASQRFRQHDDLLFVRADLMQSAFAPSSFDIIYSGGVLHHTPNTRRAFETLALLLRPGGSIFVWLYSRVSGKRYMAKLALRRAMAPLPVRIKHVLITPLVAQNALRHRSDNVSWRERFLVQLDYFTPRYRWEHTPVEVHEWFRSLGLKDVRTTDEVRDGFGVLGRSPAL